ncbi:hypothetical protein RB595_004780 [Gaeumannomyces hyphopodioides]
MKAFFLGGSSQRKGSDSAGRVETRDMRPPKPQEGHMRTVPVSGSGSLKKPLNKLFQRSQSDAAPAAPSEDAGLTAPPGSFLAPSTQPQTQYWPAQVQEQQQQQQRYAPTTTPFYPRPVDPEQHLGSQSFAPLFPDPSSIQRGMELHGDSAAFPPAPMPLHAPRHNVPQGHVPQIPPLTATGPLELPVQHHTTPMTAPYLGAPPVLDPRQTRRASGRSATTVVPPALAEPQVLPVSVTVSNLSGRPAASTEQIPHRERKLPVISDSVRELVPDIAPLKTNKRQSVPPRASSDGKVMAMNALKNNAGEPPSPAPTNDSDRAVVGAPDANHSQNMGPRGSDSEMALQAETNITQESRVDSQLPRNSVTTRLPQELAVTTENGRVPGGVKSRPSTAGDAAESESDSVLMPVSGAGADNNFPQPSIPSNQQMQSPYHSTDGDALLRRAAYPPPTGAATMGLLESPENAPTSFRAFNPHTPSERPSREKRIQQMILPYKPEFVAGDDGTVDWIETLMAFVPTLLEMGNVQSAQGSRAAAYAAVGSRSTSSGQGSAQSGRAERHLQDEIAALRKTVASLEHTKGKLQEDLRISKVKSNRRGEAIKELDVEISQLKEAMGARMSDLKRDYDDISARLSRADADRAALESSLGHARNETETQKAQNTALRETLGREIERYKGISEEWARALNDERADFQARFSALERTHQENLGKQKTAHDTAVQQLNSKFVEELKREQIDHAASVERLHNIIESARSKHQAEVEEARKKHTSEVQDLKAQNSKATADLKAKFEKETRGLRNRMAAYSTGTYTAIPDSDLVVSLRRLAQDISNLSLYVPQPAGYVPSPEADPTNHVARSLARGSSGATWPRYVQSVCWTVVLRGFFHMPLGFGALGCQGAGYQIMMPLFEMFLGKDLRDHENAPDVLPHDKETNTGRAWLIAGILRDVTKSDDDEMPSSSGTALAAIFEENVRLVSCELTAQLQHISNGGLDPGAEAQVGGVVRAIGVFALEMGSQRAQVALETCGYGDFVTLGERYGDGKSGGDAGWGQVQVDLLTQPCLVRTGDGREDLTTQKVIVKGDIVAL